ncbi:type IV pilin [Halobaculum sp. MBLA0143]|uniref:type IV pilin n=1 Tax=Halobaculum sp. MBLA0143 TaxID=3079933 RepID=UPI003525085B
MDERQSRETRAVSPVIGVILLVAIVVILAAVLGAAVFGLADTTQPTPTVIAEASFEARESVDPHWVFRLEHVGGDGISAGELTVRLVGEPGGGTAEATYPMSFGVGDTLQVGLWGSPSRASNVDCTAEPGDGPPGAGNNQLDGYRDPAHDETVRIVLIHEPSRAVVERLTVDLGAEDRRFTGDERHFLVDGAVPSFGCDDYDWDG